MQVVVEEFARTFFSFLIIMDPFTSAVYFLGISKKFTEKEKNDAINSATAIAGTTLLLFLFAGPILLSLLGITVSSFQVAGGIILLVISIKAIVWSYPIREVSKAGRSAAIMIIGVPLITGPGVLTTTMIMVGAYGYVTTILASVLALAAVWLILKVSKRIHSLIGDAGMEVSSRVMWLLLAAIAVEFVKKGILSIAA